MNPTKSYSLLLFAISLLLFSCSSHKSRTLASVDEAESVYRGQVLTEATATTSYQRTTGLMGKLFGGVSQADVEEMDKAARLKIIEKLRRDGYDLSKVVFLPSILDVKSVDVVNEAQTRSTGIFGGVSEHTYKKYEVKLEIKLDYLYLGEDPPENLERVDLSKMKLVMMSKNEVVANVVATHENLRGISVLTQKDEGRDIRQVGAQDLNLAGDQRLEIRNQVQRSLTDSSSKLEDQKYSLYLSFPTESGGKRTTVLVDSSDRLGSSLLKEVYLKGVFSKAKGSCANIMAGIFKK